jgi:hypothetical protein
MVLQSQPIWKTLLILIVLLGMTACDNGIRILNVAPEVNAIGPVDYEDGTAAITLWLYDYETDAVDVELYLLHDGTEVALTDLGGNGLLGLTTVRESAGRPHVVLWTVPENVSSTDEIRLKAIPSDGDPGRTFTTEAFTLDVGLPAP